MKAIQQLSMDTVLPSTSWQASNQLFFFYIGMGDSMFIVEKKRSKEMLNS
jgi:hypothetical protein